MPRGCTRRNCCQLGPSRRGAGSTLAVEPIGATRVPRGGAGAVVSGLAPAPLHQVSVPPQDSGGGMIRCSRRAGDSSGVSSANTAGCAQDSRDLLTWRRHTATSWRRMRISAFSIVRCRASSPSQAMTCWKIRYSSRTVTADDHAGRALAAMPQVPLWMASSVPTGFEHHQAYRPARATPSAAPGPR